MPTFLIDTPTPIGHNPAMDLKAKLADREAWDADAPPGGARFEYANLGSPVVATALEAAAGERYDALLERTVFGPLGVEACVNWVGCSDDMVARAVALYRHTDEPARDYPGDLPPGCSIPVAQGVECTLEGYTPGTNASVFEFPYAALIGYEVTGKEGVKYLCGGSLINRRYHCLIYVNRLSLGINLYLVRIHLGVKYLCGGSLINRRYYCHLYMR